MFDLEGIFEARSERPLTTIQAAVRKLRRAIMQGDLRPGQKLVEANLCRDLEISRASLREALRALAAERLIELVPNRGPSVASLDRNDVEAIHEVWALLTGEAVHHFAEIAKKEDIAALDQALDGVRRAIRAREPFELVIATNVFFMTILSHCGNVVLLDLVISLVSRINFLRAQALVDDGWRSLYAQELGEIVRAVHDRNPGAARQAVKRHIASCCAAAKRVAAVAPAEKEKKPRRRAGRPSKKAA
jgi:DNA-binding GntR family transcriptional regulator